MWQIKSPQVKPATLNFGGSGQGRVHVHQLVSEGIELINALELVDWDSEDTQFLICETCGYVHCKPGDWVSVRKSDSLVLILPASTYVWPEGNAGNEYRPPSYLVKQGIAYLDISTYEGLRSEHSSFPKLDQINPLNLREATLLFHWNAPYRVFGEPPAVRARSDIVIGSSEGDHVQCLQRIEDLMQRQYQVESFAEFRSLTGEERVISLYLDAAEFMEWDALVFDGSDYKLLVDSKYVIAPTTGG